MPPRTEAANDAPEWVIECRRSAWNALRNRSKLTTDTALAETLGLNQSTVSRTFTTGVASERFVAHTLAAFPFASFDKLFAIAAKSKATR